MRASSAPSRRRPAVRPPARGQPPSAAFTPADIDASAEELIAFHQLFQECFPRREQRQWSLFYLCGQLSNMERKTIESMVLGLPGADPHAVRAAQRFITESPWDRARLSEMQHAVIAADLGESDAGVIVEGSGFPKQGEDSIGVAPQYGNHLGKVANCQQGVFLVYVSARGYAFLDERLYLPACWFTDAYRARRKACHLPAEVRFQTEPHLALEMITALVHQAVIPFHWVTADASYGKNLDFLEEIDRLGKWAFIEIPSDTRVWLRTPPLELAGPGLLGRPRVHPRVARTAPPPQAVRDLLAQGPRLTWVRQTIKEGSKGPLVAEFAFLRVTPMRDNLPATRVWLIRQRTLSPQPEIKFYFSNAPTTCPPREFIRVSGLRWPVETTLKEGKGQVGMDQNETRSWLAWHHHLRHVFLAHLFLIHLRRRWPDRPALTTAQARLLIAQAIAEEARPWRNVLAILHYRQRRNYAAYCSHRKRTVKRQQQISLSQKRKKRSSVSQKSPEWQNVVVMAETS